MEIMPPKEDTPAETAKTKAGGYLEHGTVGSFEKSMALSQRLVVYV